MQAEPTPHSTEARSYAGKYLTFQLAREVYGLEILKVREIIGLMDVTPVPRTPPHIRGVINLRGKIIPVVDLRVKFSLEPAPDTERTCIIVVDLAQDAGTVQMGVVVDAVSEVLSISAEQIVPPPSFGAGVRADYIRGLAKTAGRVGILLNVEEVLSAADQIDVAEHMHADAAAHAA
jgi:purine-binding chemotaxis protein CheW